MNGNNKIWASVAGVSITAAVVIGAALGANAHHAPAQQPAGHPTPLASTVTVTAAAARPAVAAPAAVSPSKSKTVAHRRHKAHQAAVVVNQEPAVTDPASSTPDPAEPSSEPAHVDPIHGSAVRHGPTDAPASRVEIGYPDDTLSPSPKE
jgi:hypothetical protein